MAEAVPAAGAPRVSRLDRRKAQTRRALTDAAVRLIAEGREDRASIAEITEQADIGFGSFYNHFDSKEQLFQTAAEEVLERWGQMIDRATAGITDPAELFAVGMRISGRLGWTHPDIAGFLTGMGLDALDIPGGLAPRALRDIEAGQASGRFTVPDAEVALSAVAGGLLGLLRMCQRHPERVDETTVDQLAEAELRLLGVPAGEAARLAALPIPDTARGNTPTMPPTAFPVSNVRRPGRRGRGDGRPGLPGAQSYRGLGLTPASCFVHAPHTRDESISATAVTFMAGSPRRQPPPPGRIWSAPRLEVSAPEPAHAGIDGEAVELSPPLRFAIRPAALRVNVHASRPLTPSLRRIGRRQQSIR
jgi:AcrR family transcriptional regulator